MLSSKRLAGFAPINDASARSFRLAHDSASKMDQRGGIKSRANHNNSLCNSEITDGAANICVLVRAKIGANDDTAEIGDGRARDAWRRRRFGLRIGGTCSSCRGLRALCDPSNKSRQSDTTR